MRARMAATRLAAAGLLAAGLGLAARAVWPQEGAGVVVVWSTASEVGTAGFNLYRGTGPAGPFGQVNEGLIPARGDPLLGGTYAFTDSTSSSAAYYVIEEIDAQGQAVRHGPVELGAGLAGGVRPPCSGALAGAAAALVWRRAASRRGSRRGP